jgi:hypothetical protein
VWRDGVALGAQVVASKILALGQDEHSSGEMFGE